MTIRWSGHDQEGNAASGSIPVTVTPRPILVPPVFGDGTNRAADLQAFIVAQPDGSILDMTGLSVRSDQTVKLTGRTLTVKGGLLFTDHPTGDASTLAAPSTAARTRAHWRITGGRVTFRGCQVRGANAGGGTADAAYVAALEAQHGWDCTDASVTLDGCGSSFVYGDAAYFGGAAGGCTASAVLSGEFHHTGRQGIGVTWVDGLLVQGASIHDIRRSVVDFEPNFTYGWVRNARFVGNTTGAARLSFVASKGAAAPVDDVEISGNTASGPMIVTAGNTARRRHGWRVVDNVSTGSWGSAAGSACMVFTATDGLVVTGNRQPLQAGRGNYLVALVDCPAADVHGNTWTGGVGEVAP